MRGGAAVSMRSFDPRDFAIYRAMHPRSEARFWCSRSVVDPRIGLSEVARCVGMTEGAVRARLAYWRAIGFLRGHDVWPNPALFGVSIKTVEIRGFPDGAAADRVLGELGLIEGMLAARIFHDEGGRSVRAFLVDDGLRGVARRVELLRRIASSGVVSAPASYWTPAPSLPISRFDWRLLRMCRRFPDARVGELAALLGSSPKTVALRRARLLDSGAMWWYLDVNVERLPAVGLYARVGSSGHRESVKRSVGQLVRAWVPFSDDGFGLPPSPGHDQVAGLAWSESPASRDSLVRAVLTLPNVRSVTTRAPHAFASFPEWLDTRLEERVLRLGLEPDSRSPPPSEPSLESEFFSDAPFEVGSSPRLPS
jgi:DNA-binding Lrp family transcriptional regulator